MKKTTDRPEPTKQAVWDLPTRLFHWVLAALIGFSWWSAEEEQLDLHIWSGYAVMTLVLFRLLWGVFGSSTARFGNFVRGPASVAAYVRDMRGWRAIGHSPLGALSVLALLALVVAQVATGLVNSDNDGLVEGPLAVLVSGDIADAAHDLHEVLFNVLLVFIGLHIAAVLYYRLVLGKKLIAPMVTGKAALDPDTAPMTPARGWVAVACLVAALVVTRWVIAGAPPLGT